MQLFFFQGRKKTRFRLLSRCRPFLYKRLDKESHWQHSHRCTRAYRAASKLITLLGKSSAFISLHLFFFPRRSQKESQLPKSSGASEAHMVALSKQLCDVPIYYWDNTMRLTLVQLAFFFFPRVFFFFVFCSLSQNAKGLRGARLNRAICWHLLVPLDLIG